MDTSTQSDDHKSAFKLLLDKEVQEQFQVSPDTLYRLRKTGKLRFIRFPGGDIRYRQEDVNAFVEAHLRQGGRRASSRTLNEPETKEPRER